MDRFVEQTIKKTIVILDNSPIHKSKKFIAKIEQWKEKDVFDLLFTTVFSGVKSDRNSMAKNKIAMVRFGCLQFIRKPQRKIKVCAD